MVTALLCSVAAVLLQSAHARTVPGASGPLPDSDSGDGGSGRWSWSYLDATPADAAFPFRLGVADRDQRDRHGGRFVPAIRYAHGAVAIGDEMIITHGSPTHTHAHKSMRDGRPADHGRSCVANQRRSLTGRTHRSCPGLPRLIVLTSLIVLCV